MVSSQGFAKTEFPVILRKILHIENFEGKRTFHLPELWRRSPRGGVVLPGMRLR